MANKSGCTGPGLLTAIVELRQHWVTWAVSGGPTKCHLRIPVSWTAMTGVEAIAHVKHYQKLPATPAPHPLAVPTTHDDNFKACPYTHSLTEEERDRLATRLDEITSRKWEWRPEGERRRRGGRAEETGQTEARLET